MRRSWRLIFIIITFTRVQFSFLGVREWIGKGKHGNWNDKCGKTGEGASGRFLLCRYFESRSYWIAFKMGEIHVQYSVFISSLAKSVLLRRFAQKVRVSDKPSFYEDIFAQN